MIEEESIAMGVINIGGRMPDGVKVHDFWVEESDVICASGVALQKGSKKKLMGKLCLTTTSLIMLPYEGLVLKIGEMLIQELQNAILGEYASMADAMQKLGLLSLNANYEKLDRVMIWPLHLLEREARVEEHHFLFLHGGASLIIFMGGEEYDFQMANRGHEIGEFASAQDFCEHINELMY
jgi:hypothetical protein